MEALGDKGQTATTRLGVRAPLVPAVPLPCGPGQVPCLLHCSFLIRKVEEPQIQMGQSRAQKGRKGAWGLGKGGSLWRCRGGQLPAQVPPERKDTPRQLVPARRRPPRMGRLWFLAFSSAGRGERSAREHSGRLGKPAFRLTPTAGAANCASGSPRRVSASRIPARQGHCSHLKPGSPRLRGVTGPMSHSFS